MWLDLRLRLLTEIGYLPSHTVRNFFYRRAGVDLHSSASIHWRAEFYAPENLTVGEHSIIGDSCFLDARDTVTIGKNVNIGSHVAIYTRQHDIDAPDFAEVGGPVIIGDYAYVASWARILPGVRIGRGAVVALGAVVTKDVEPFTLVAGVPARFIRKRSEDLTYVLGYSKRFV